MKKVVARPFRVVGRAYTHPTCEASRRKFFGNFYAETFVPRVATHSHIVLSIAHKKTMKMQKSLAISDPEKPDFGDAQRIVQKMLDQNSATADYATSIYNSGMQSLRARIPRMDELSQLIMDVAAEKFEISAKQLCRQLDKFVGQGVIVELTDDDFVVWKTSSGKTKKTPVSGLNDRLCRAKKHLKKKSR